MALFQRGLSSLLRRAAPAAALAPRTLQPAATLTIPLYPLSAPPALLANPLALVKPFHASAQARDINEPLSSEGPSEEDPIAGPPAATKIYIGNVSWETRSEDLKPIFESYGAITYCEVIMDPNGRSRGFGFLEFETPEEAKAAVEATNGMDVDGRQIRVDYVLPRGESRPRQAPRTEGMGIRSGGMINQANKIYVGNVPWSMEEADLKDTFEQFGDVAECRIVYDRDTGRSRGFAFVTMRNGAEMERAIQGLDGAVADGRELRVNAANRNE